MGTLEIGNDGYSFTLLESRLRELARGSVRRLIGTLFLLLLVALALPGCSVSKFDKYATLRFYEGYRTNIQYSYFDEEAGARSSPNFRNEMLPMRVADNNQWMDFTDNLGSIYMTLGKRLKRDTFPAGLEPITEFIAWSRLSPPQRLKARDALNAREEFTSIKARLVLERDTDEPLLVYSRSSLPFTEKPAYAVDSVNAERMLKMAVIWHKDVK